MAGGGGRGLVVNRKIFAGSQFFRAVLGIEHIDRGAVDGRRGIGLIGIGRRTFPNEFTILLAGRVNFHGHGYGFGASIIERDA